MDSDQLEIAVAAIAELERMHDEFVAHVASKGQLRGINGGSFSAEGENFSADVLRIPLRVSHRPVTVGGRLAALEYAFIAEHRGLDLCLLRIYLGGSTVLFLDPKLSNVLCDAKSPYLESRLVAELANAALKSPLFAPG